MLDGRMVLLAKVESSGVRLSYIVGSGRNLRWLHGTTIAGRSLCGQAEDQDSLCLS
jgi:hypothetical protein